VPAVVAVRLINDCLTPLLPSCCAGQGKLEGHGLHQADCRMTSMLCAVGVTAAILTETSQNCSSPSRFILSQGWQLLFDAVSARMLCRPGRAG
jgi:hypothetical protein